MKNDRPDSARNVHVPTLLAAITIPLIVGGISSFITAEDMKLYETFNRPPLAPPGWVFPVVWTILYVLMGTASYYVVTSGYEPNCRRRALTFYAAQLVMNLFWSSLFFSNGWYLISLIWLLVMWVLILVCTVSFFRIRRAAGVMMSVLLLWTTFAAYLNAAFYVMSITPVPV